MARLSPIAAVALVAGLLPLPAQAQLDSIFGPLFRPPASVPNSGRQVPPPPADLQQPASRGGPPAGVQTRPLPPPPGVAVIDPILPAPPSSIPGQPPGGRQPRGTPVPTDTSPSDQAVAEPPSQKIANKSALFSG